MQTSKYLEFFVTLASPRSYSDFFLKAVAINIILSAIFVLFEIWLHDGRLLYLSYQIIAILMISVPLSCLGLAAIWYLTTLRRELIHLATTDLLTGLNNRRAFMDAAETAVSQSRGILMMLDLDHFKRINDTYGHTVGDDCLRAMAEVLREQLRSEDIVGRLGGEEFGIFLVDAPLDAARKIGERLSAGTEHNLKDADRVVNITASIGAVEMPANDNLETILTLADMAMYQAKESGRARLVFWEKGVTSRARAESAA